MSLADKRSWGEIQIDARGESKWNESRVPGGQTKLGGDTKKMAERTGLEPATPGVTGRYSNQLNYRSTICKPAADVATDVLLY